MNVLTNRKTKVQSWYLDVNFLASYWGSERVYHHTAPITMNYALHEALRLVLEDGLEARWERHQQAHEALKAGLAKLGLSILARSSSGRGGGEKEKNQREVDKSGRTGIPRAPGPNFPLLPTGSN